MLENNHSNMATVVETFYVEETASLIYDNDHLSEWENLSEQLGLNGQKNIAKPKKSPIPFMPLNKRMERIAETLCPRKVEVSEYSVSPIPLEILRLIALSNKEEYFQKIEIWYDDETPDPFCIGHIGKWYEQEFYGNSNKSLSGMRFASRESVIDAGGKHPSFLSEGKYLLGKWGDVKQDFDQLAERACRRYVIAKSVEFEEMIKKGKRGLEDLKTESLKKFGFAPDSNDELPF